MQERTIPHNDHAWLIEPLFELESFVPRRMFGCLACYLFGKLTLVLADTEEPWNGVLVATEHSQHHSLRQSFPPLQQHPVLGKWLYIPYDHEKFESVVAELVKLCLSEDPRIGVVPKPKKNRRGASKKSRQHKPATEQK